MDHFFTDILFDFLSATEKSTDRAQLLGAIESVNRRLGIKYFAMAFWPLAHERLDSYFIWENWPQEWLERYLKNNYFHADPVVSLLRNTGRPFVWSQSIRPNHLANKPKRIMTEASDFGLRDGLTIPLLSRAGLGGVLSVSGTREPMKQWEIDLLQIVAENVHRRLLDLGPTPPKTYDDLHVTRSESECLTLCSAGKTDKEIGAITHRSQRTVQAHLQNLQRKLGAANRAQLIAEAFRRGLQR